MGENSIRSNLSKEDIIAETKLMLGADFERKRTILIVEGNDDVCFFTGRVGSNVTIQESHSGKIGVEEIVRSFSDSRVVGIRDADYDTDTDCSRLFYYDYSCLEMMLIANDTAFSQFVYAYCQRVEPIVTRLKLLDNLKWISLYRKLSCENHWDINFSGISIAEAYDHSKEAVDISKLLSQIKKINPQKSESIVSHVKRVTTCYREACNLETYLSITQGHDFLYLFQAFYDALKGKKGQTINVVGIFKSLLCSYGEICFSETKLYQQLTVYQDIHGVIIVKSPNYCNG